MATKLLFKISTKARPIIFFKNLDMLLSNLSNKIDYLVSVSIDLDDNTMCNMQTINKLNKYAKNYNLNFFIGKSINKVDALNRDISKVDFKWDAIIPITDYMEFCVNGFDDEIRKIETLGYGKLKNNLLSIESINNNGKIKKQLYIMGRHLYKSRGYLYNPKFISVLYKEELEKLKSQINFNSLVKNVFNYRHSDWFYYKTDLVTSSKMENWKKDLQTLELLTNEN